MSPSRFIFTPLCFIAELGDRSFFLTAILSAWCPFYGVRSGAGSPLQQCLVAAGSIAAVSLHAALMMVPLENFTEVTFKYVGGFACIVQVALGCQARSHLEAAPDEIAVPSTLASKERPSENWAYMPESYGAAEQGERKNPFTTDANAEARSHDAKALEAQGSGRTLSIFSASFLVPFLCVFSVKPIDRSLHSLHIAKTAASTVGGLSGCALALLVAVAFGFFLERYLSERRILLGVTLGLWSLCLMSLSREILMVYDGSDITSHTGRLPHQPTDFD